LPIAPFTEPTSLSSLGTTIAGGAVVILIPEILYDLEFVAGHLLVRRKHGKRFSIIAVTEEVRSFKETERDRVESESAGDKRRSPTIHRSHQRGSTWSKSASRAV
jgi:6-phosphofructokinase